MSAYDHIGEGDAGALTVNDYIYSPSRLYFIVLEANGQLNTYAGDSPDDPQKIQVGTSATTVPPGGQDLMLILRKGPFDQNIKNLQIFWSLQDGPLEQLWKSPGSTDLASPMEAYLGDDGRLILRQNQRGIWNQIWNNGFSDPVVEYIVEKIDYDTSSAKIKSDSDNGMLEQILQNNTDAPQQMHMSKKTNTTVVSSWSNATGFKATIGGSVTAGVPGVASGTVSFSGASGK